jgi:hypothetical protein
MLVAIVLDTIQYLFGLSGTIAEYALRVADVPLAAVEQVACRCMHCGLGLARWTTRAIHRFGSVVVPALDKEIPGALPAVLRLQRGLASGCSVLEAPLRNSLANELRSLGRATRELDFDRVRDEMAFGGTLGDLPPLEDAGDEGSSDMT